MSPSRSRDSAASIASIDVTRTKQAGADEIKLDVENAELHPEHSSTGTNTVAMSALAHCGGGWRSLLELPR